MIAQYSNLTAGQDLVWVVLLVNEYARSQCKGSRLQQGWLQTTIIKEIVRMQSQKKSLRIVAISDTHGKHKDLLPDLPPADIFIHCGDFTKMSRESEFNKFCTFIEQLPYKHKIVIAGNHDFGLEPNQQRYEIISQLCKTKQKDKVNPAQQIQKLKSICTYLHHECVQVEGLKIFGSPYVNADYQMGFTYLDEQGDKVWKDLPEQIDILVTHCPPYGICDVTHLGYHVGCKHLKQTVDTVKPRIHVFGHIHESAGNVVSQSTHFYNVAFLDHNYQIANKPTTFDIQLRY